MVHSKIVGGTLIRFHASQYTTMYAESPRPTALNRPQRELFAIQRVENVVSGSCGVRQRFWKQRIAAPIAAFDSRGRRQIVPMPSPPLDRRIDGNHHVPGEAQIASAPRIGAWSGRSRALPNQLPTPAAENNSPSDRDSRSTGAPATTATACAASGSVAPESATIAAATAAAN